MKKYIWIFIFLVVLAIIALLLWRRPVQLPVVEQSSNAPITTANAASYNPRPAAPTPLVNQPHIVTHKVETPEQARQEIESANVPIDIYGLVIDQDSNPVPDVTINVAARHWTMPDPNVEMAGSTNVQAETVSGSDGRFEIHGITGDGGGFTVVPKDGYILSSKASPGFGGGTSGSYENPVIFKMWKKGAETQLIGGNHIFGIDSGKLYTLDLITGKKIQGEADGDLLVTVTRPPNAKPRDKFPWSFSIQAIQGGFAEPDPNDEFMYIAPASGYQPKIEMQFDPNDPAWVDVVNGGLQSALDYAMYLAPAEGYMPTFHFVQTVGSGWGDSTGERRFYITLNDGQEYGRITIELYAYYNKQIPGMIRLSYAINPSGSRILR